MESPIWPESLPNNRIKAIHELNKGQEWTNKLCEALSCLENVDFDPTSVDGVVVQILEMFQNTITIMGSTCTNLHSSDHSLEEQNPKTIIPVKIKRRCTKTRKTSWTSTKVTSDLKNDGHAWRKYGQKEILNAKHQRSYYRCTYKFDQGCLATKQVQKIQDKPPNYKITYFGNHTCNNLQRAPPIILDSPADPTNYKSIVFNFETKELINKKQCAPKIRMQQELKDVIIPSLGNLTHNQTSSCNNNPSWDPFTHVSHVPTESVSLMSSWFDHEEMVSPSTYSSLDYGNEDNISSWAYSSMTSTHGYHMNNVSEKNDFNCFSF